MITARMIALALAALAGLAGPMQAQAQAHRAGHPGHFYHGYPYHTRVAIGFGFGFGPYYPYSYYPYYYGSPYYYGAPWSPGYVVMAPPEERVQQAPASRVPEPIFYPRNGQSATQTETDRRECNRWATTQQDAMADSSVFQRATLACMEGRGYTVR